MTPSDDRRQSEAYKPPEMESRRQRGERQVLAESDTGAWYRVEREAIRLRRLRWLEPPALELPSGKSLPAGQRQAPDAEAWIARPVSDPTLKAYARQAPEPEPARGFRQRAGNWLRKFLHPAATESTNDPQDDVTTAADCPHPPPHVPVNNLVGLALSGGGIRSASFNLGVLQGMHKREALWMFDYLSTVSGGGFIGCWWSAWLSRRTRRSGEIFPAPEELEPQRRSATARLLRHDGANRTPSGQPDGSVVARREDPIHFVRLFSNYLTPNKGALSPDTWRLIAFVTRNLLFTWLALLPLLLAAVMAGQMYFLHNEGVARAFLCESYGENTQPVDAPFCNEFNANPPEHPLKQRLADFGRLLVVPVAIYATLVFLWLAYASAHLKLAVIGFVVVIWAAFSMISRLYPSTGAGQLMWYAIGAVLLTVGAHLWRRAKDRIGAANGTSEPFLSDDAMRTAYRGVLSNRQATLQKWIVLASALLLIAGFGHDLVYNVFFKTKSYVTEAGGWAVVLATIGTTLYTAIKAAPRTDGNPPPRVGGLDAFIFSVAPGLALLVLTLSFAVLSRALLLETMKLPSPALMIANAVIWLALLQVLFAMFESSQDPAGSAPAWWRRHVPVWLRRLLRMTPPPATKRTRLFFSPRAWLRVVVGAAAAVVTYYARDVSVAGFWNAVLTPGPSAVAVLVLGVTGGLTFAHQRLRVALGSFRPVGLLVMASFTATLCLLANSEAAASFQRASLLAGLLWLSLLVGGVIAMGWLADPNLLSLHAFYKGRLTRAYLGASNEARDNEEITDSAPGDDLSLKDLWNHDAGAPYHVINTTMSLVGGSDLATSQRSAENFILSRYHCGSARAGYRCTSQYMSGQMSLGTAAAISGAAVSPTMGSETPSAALALLLALLNLRLGFWAPNPSGNRWDEPQARLWPLYLLRETLSNTGRMGPYCYLTDGGHFDNTGLYALVERGCRYIVVCDCGADPGPGFEDIGNAIRRCRIDFGAEFDLDVDPFLARDASSMTGRTHVVVGKINYNVDHLMMLGLDPTQREGKLIWIKPSVSAMNAADVRQYKLANGKFPQQPTSDQSYDESQFESYRRLGYESALQAFDNVTTMPPRGTVQLPPLPARGDFSAVEPWFESRANRT